MKGKSKHVGLRITDTYLHYKLHYIAKYEDRSANGYIMQLIRKDIQRFESEHGEIQTPGEAKNK